MLRAPYHAPRFPWPLPRNRSLRFALAVLVASALLQLLTAGWGLHRRQSRITSSQKREAPNAEPSAQTEPINSPLLLKPRLDSPSIRAPWQEFLETSRTAHANRETGKAFKALLDAEATVPELPTALSELAIQYEKIGLPQRAIKLWEKIQKMGPSAGVFFEAANTKLSLLSEHTEDSIRPSVTSPTVPNLPKPGLLKFGTFSATNAPENSNERRLFSLRVPVTRSENATVNASQVFLQVQFYDQLNGGPIERTNAKVSWEWSKNPVDWSSSRTQYLIVGYSQGPARSANEVRRFYGYVASIYYDGKLLDSRANPPRLGQQYPPPRMISREVTP